MMKLDKNWPKQADLTVFALDPRGARAPFAPWIRRCTYIYYHCRAYQRRTGQYPNYSHSTRQMTFTLKNMVHTGSSLR